MKIGFFFLFWLGIYFLSPFQLSAKAVDPKTKVTLSQITMTSFVGACKSTFDSDVQHLCKIVHDYFGEEQDSYLSLGQGFYVIVASNTGTVGQGIYIVNTKRDDNRSIKQHGGYGLPDIKTIKKLTDGTIQIEAEFSSMMHGHYNHARKIILVINNSITHTPYLFIPTIKKSVLPSAIIKVHQKALNEYRKNKRSSLPYQLMEEAGVWNILFEKPKNMPFEAYIQILNDFAFFAYQYGEGHCELAIDVLDRVIALSPNRRSAYLNMSDALKEMAKYSSTPLEKQTIQLLQSKSEEYLHHYQVMKK